MNPSSLDISVADVTVSLAGKIALRTITWQLAQGENWAFFGPNGAGKSTLLRLLRGDIRPDQTPRGTTRGSVTWVIDGKGDTSPLAIKPFARLVSAEQQRMYTRNGWSITGLGLIISGLTDSLLPSPPDAVHISAAISIAEKMSIPYLLDTPITSMSQGQLRLVLLARAMVSTPRLILLDEPFDGLDTTTRNVLHAAVNNAAQTATIVLTAHREQDILECVTHTLHLEKGKTLASGPITNKADERCTLETCVPSQAVASSAPPASAPSQAAWVGKTPSPFQEKNSLEFSNVDVYVDRVKILHSLTWHLPAKQNWRITGPNGSGKSTLLRLIAGLEHVALGGKFIWFGESCPPLKKRLCETGYVSDQLHATYAYDITGLELVLSGFDGSVGLWRKYTRKERDEAKHWVNLLGLFAMAHTPVSRLSNGTSRRFFLARALVGPVRLLLLDEPCSGLDTRSKDQFLAYLDMILAANVQCLYVSHHNSDVPARVTHEMTLDRGEIVHTGKITHRA